MFVKHGLLNTRIKDCRAFRKFFCSKNLTVDLFLLRKSLARPGGQYFTDGNTIVTILVQLLLSSTCVFKDFVKPVLNFSHTTIKTFKRITRNLLRGNDLAVASSRTPPTFS